MARCACESDDRAALARLAQRVPRSRSAKRSFRGRASSKPGQPKGRWCCAHYFLDSPRMAPLPAGLEQCALPNLPAVGDIANWLRLEIARPRVACRCAGLEALHAIPSCGTTSTAGCPSAPAATACSRSRSRGCVPLQRRILHELLEYVPAHEAAHGFRPRLFLCDQRAAARRPGDRPAAGPAGLLCEYPGAGLALCSELSAIPSQAAAVLAGLCTNRVPADVVDARDAGRYDFELPQLDWFTRKRYRSPHLPQGAPSSPRWRPLLVQPGSAPAGAG